MQKWMHNGQPFTQFLTAHLMAQKGNKLKRRVIRWIVHTIRSLMIFLMRFWLCIWSAASGNLPRKICAPANAPGAISDDDLGNCN